MIKTRVIDLTSDNVSAREDIRVEFTDKDKSQVFGPSANITQVPGMRMFKEVTKFEARNWREIGFTGLVDERLVIFANPDDEESLDKLVGLQNFIGFYFHVLFRLTGDNIDKKPSISLVFTNLPYVWKDNIPTAKNNKVAACLRWKNRLAGYINIKIISRGEFGIDITDEKSRSTFIGPKPPFFDQVGSKVNVDTTMVGFYETSVRTTVHVMNPITDVLYSSVFYHLLDETDAIWVSPTIETLLGKAYIEDLFEKNVISTHEDVKRLMYSKRLEVKDLGEASCVEKDDVKKIAVLAVSPRDFMTFSQEIVMAAANTRDSSSPMILDLFINFSIENADDQGLYEIENNFMNFIEDRAPLIVPNFWIADIDAVCLSDVPDKLLKYVPKNIFMYHSKILDSIC